MNLHHPFLATVFFAALMIPSLSRSEEADKTLLRIVCVSGMEAQKEIILAARDEGEKWRELGASPLRDSMITVWLSAQAGEIHLAERMGDTLKSLCRFDYPADTNRGLLILAADPETKNCAAHFVDPKKERFGKGGFLVFNLSPQSASVFLGAEEQRIAAGQRIVVKPTLEENGMFRMQVSRTIADSKSEACYDRYVPGKQDSREMIFLLPDPQTGLKVTSISLFSDLE